MFTPLDKKITSYTINKNNTNPIYIKNGGSDSILGEIMSELADKVLPHGSGINCDWRVERTKDLTFICSNSYHAMDQNGRYCGYVDFNVIVDLNTKEFNIEVCIDDIEAITGSYEEGTEGDNIETNCPYLDDLDDYLHETVDYAIECYHVAESITYLANCKYYRELMKRTIRQVESAPA